ncbi:MAG: glycoside hydrolase family 3 protein [Thermoanaerobaculia bacterium]|nr:glycoside hydrolase family 3 protein [Thermoanaerobaculia bacterium]
MSGARLVVGLAGTALSVAERSFLEESRPAGVLLFPENLASAEQAAALVAEVRAACDPSPLLFVDQEGGPVDRLGPLFGFSFPSPAALAAMGVDRVHEGAYLMGRAARLLGFDVDLAPVLDLEQPGTGAVVLAGRTFGFHAEDVVVAGSVFLHGLARAGIASCLKHFPGLGRGPVDSHGALPVVDAHDVDLMVTDVAPFTKLARSSDAVLVGHAAYPGFTGDETPASLSPRIHAILRERIGWDGVVLSDDLGMGALAAIPLEERIVRAARSGCDLLVVSQGLDAARSAAAALAAESIDREPAALERIAALRHRCEGHPRTRFGPEAWDALRAEGERWLLDLAKPRARRDDSAFGF